MSIHCRPIIKVAEVETLVDLYGLIWYTDDRDAIPSHIMIALIHAGGVLLGAYDGELAVGFSLAFPGIRDDRLILWSHVTGILPAYQGRGIGSQLKLVQRDIAQERGYDCISWTYDPLQRKNAIFNIRQLGCVCRRYHEDFYGEAVDGLNRGLPTDRFEVDWWLGSARVKTRLSHDSRGDEVSLSVDALVLAAQPDGGPFDIVWPDEGKEVYIEVPEDINLLRKNAPSLAANWRFRTREAFQGLFARGYEINDVVTVVFDGKRRTLYQLAKQPV